LTYTQEHHLKFITKLQLIFFKKLYDKGGFTEQVTEQYYDEASSTFLADRFIKGTCPHCKSDRAFGDQCESCGTALSPDELINPVSTISGQAPVKKLTSHWYLPLAKHEAFLKDWILTQHKDDWRASVVGQCKSWIEGGLQSRAVTRDLNWGVKVPLADAEGKVLYVWFDAPIGYISATKQWAIDNNKDWKPYWYDNDTQLVHFIGKDNIVFHCIIFPTMLKLHGNILPTNVPANEFLNLEGDKMSTSRNWKLEMRDFINDFVKKENGGEQCVDMLRYYLTQIAPESKDSEFTWKGFQDAVNSELVSIFGNYVNRTFVLMHKLCNGKVPTFHAEVADEKDQQIANDILATKEKVETSLEQYRFREALFEVIDLARKGNRYMQEKEPWIVAKGLAEDSSKQQLIDNSLHQCLQLTANLAILIQPFLPATAKKMCYMMKVVDKMLDWENAGSMKLLSVGYSLREPQLLFRKIEDQEIAAQIEKLKSGAMQAAPEPAKTNDSTAPLHDLKAEIVFDDFGKIDLRTGIITAAQKVPKADKLLQLEVDLGFETRTILSGIAMHFDPEAVVGQKVVVVANLAPRKMRGIDSNGMILMAEDAEGKLHFVSAGEVTKGGWKVS